MIKIFLESDKFSHKAGVTKHATIRWRANHTYCLCWEIKIILRVLIVLQINHKVLNFSLTYIIICLLYVI